jgi:hypothetical protein
MMCWNLFCFNFTTYHALLHDRRDTTGTITHTEAHEDGGCQRHAMCNQPKHPPSSLSAGPCPSTTRSLTSTLHLPHIPRHPPTLTKQPSLHTVHSAPTPFTRQKFSLQQRQPRTTHSVLPHQAPRWTPGVTARHLPSSSGALLRILLPDDSGGAVACTDRSQQAGIGKLKLLAALQASWLHRGPWHTCRALPAATLSSGWHCRFGAAPWLALVALPPEGSQRGRGSAG